MHSHSAEKGQGRYSGGVLILVVMEDALALILKVYFQKMVKVLILVVMEDALAPYRHQCTRNKLFRLNPCCNGRCTRTAMKLFLNGTMESLNPCCNGRCTRTIRLRGGYL